MNEADLIARYSAPAPRYTSYPTAPHFSPAIGSKTYLQWLGEADDPLSIYLHVPFCRRLCLYCGCNTSVVHLESSLRAYGDALAKEIELVARAIGRRAKVSHLHWGAERRRRCRTTSSSRRWTCCAVASNFKPARRLRSRSTQRR